MTSGSGWENRGSPVYNFDDPDGYIYRLNQENKLVFIDTLKSKYIGGCYEPGEDGFVCRELGGVEHVQQFCKFHKVPYPAVYPRARYELIFDCDKRTDFSAGYVRLLCDYCAMTPPNGTK